MYSLDCDYYDREFKTMVLLLDDIVASGQDPNYEMTKNGRGLGETAFDQLVF